MQQNLSLGKLLTWRYMDGLRSVARFIINQLGHYVAKMKGSQIREPGKEFECWIDTGLGNQDVSQNHHTIHPSLSERRRINMLKKTT